MLFIAINVFVSNRKIRIGMNAIHSINNHHNCLFIYISFLQDLSKIFFEEGSYLFQCFSDSFGTVVQIIVTCTFYDVYFFIVGSCFVIQIETISVRTKTTNFVANNYQKWLREEILCQMKGIKHN